MRGWPLLIASVLAFGCAGTVIAQSLSAGRDGTRPTLKSVPLAPPGTGLARVPLPELQDVKLENISLRFDKVTTPLILERNALMAEICELAGFEPVGCTVNTQSLPHTVTGKPREQTPEIAPGGEPKKKKRKHDAENTR